MPRTRLFPQRMTKRFSLRVPDVMVEALEKRAEQESVRLGRPVEAGTVARDFIQRALEDLGMLPSSQPRKRVA